MPADPSNRFAAPWLDPNVRSSLDSMLASMALRMGFRAGTVSLARHNEFTVAVSYGYGHVVIPDRPDALVSDYLGRSWPVDRANVKLDSGTTVGLVTFLPAGVVPPDSPWGWAPLSATDGDTEWQNGDQLILAIRNDEGELRGALALAEPVNGRRPDEDSLIDFNRVARHLTAPMLAAIEHQAVSERLRVANAGRQIIRGLIKPQTIENALDDAVHTLLDHLGLSALWVQVFDEDGRTMHVRTMGDAIDDLPDRRRAGEREAARLWAEEGIGLVTPETSIGFSPAPVPRMQTFLEASGYGSMVLVPAGAGARCLGTLWAVRADCAPAWTADELEEIQEMGRDLGVALAVALTHAIESNARRELERLADFRAELVSTVSHELRSPLTTASFNLELAIKAIEDPATSRSLQRVDRGLIRMRKVVDDLLRLSRSATAEKRDPWTAVDLAALTTELCDIDRAWARSRSISLETEVHGRMFAAGSPDELRRVLTNLISNAIKYTPEGGRVLVTVRPRSDEEVEIIVADTGIGLSAEDQRGVFEEFFRSVDPRARAEEGNGLGLPIARRIVHDHGGRIGLSSTLNQGSSFWVRLPRLAAPAPEA